MGKLILSLVAVNVALAAWFFVSLKQGQAPTAAAPQAMVETTPASPANPPTSMGSQASSSPTAKKVNWQALASSDLKKYVANLRVVGCPEETIKDIIVAEVNRKFLPREKALKINPDDRQPWDPIPKGVAAFNRLHQIRDLLTEKKALLKDLIGVDVPMELPEDLIPKAAAKFEAAFAALPEQKREAARAAHEDFMGKIDDLKAKTMGILEPGDVAELQKLKDARRAELARILTPDELLNFEMKTSTTADWVKNRMAGFTASEAETKALFQRAQALEQTLGPLNYFDPADPEANKRRSKEQADFQQSVKDILGDQRFAEYEKARDPEYKKLTAAATQANLQPEVVEQAYQIGKITKTEVAKVMADRSLTPEQRQQTVQSMRDESNKALVGLLGQQAFDQLKQQNNNNNRTRITAPVPQPVAPLPTKN